MLGSLGFHRYTTGNIVELNIVIGILLHTIYSNFCRDIDTNVDR